MRVTSVFAVLAIASLSACGGSSTSSSGSISTSFEQLSSASAEQLRERGEALLAQYDSVVDTTIEQMDVQTGTATYAGVTAFAENPDFTLDEVVATSAISLTADFGADSISGQMTNFYEENDAGDFVSIEGSLDVTGGTITDNTFTAAVSGDLATLEGEQSVSGTLDGGFIGSGAEAVEGDIDGTVGGLPVFGGFIAERQ